MNTTEPIAGWSRFLAEWGVDPALARSEPLTGGLINENFLLTEGDRRYVVRCYRRTKEPDDIEYELLAVEFLRAAGFPTAGPVRSLSGALSGEIGGRPAAVFEYVDGSRAPSRSGGFGSFDLALGCEIAGAVARMHRLTWELRLPVRRAERADPLRRVEEFLETVQGWHGRELVPGLEELVSGLAEVSSRVRSVLESEKEIPSGLVHADVTETNVLVDHDGHLLALLDFDDCLDSYRLYDLCSVVSSWGLDDERRLDVERAAQLISAYTEARPVTQAEQQVLPGLLTVYVAAGGCEFLTGVWERKAFVDGVSDSFAATTFLSLLGDTAWQDSLRDACVVADQR